ncbi:2-hydroxychromene-2-carboxylate isomerase [Maricaulis salignorans]|uniref:2-hydroxychromene-2-carboxylate isomerase n=1 Tax=Maricaulis salignorans TaxID=144026 RepID=A0A1G9M1Z9_9PROT|nr:2-hydroxychromene-2-carboxylate isomerase [Maricaulis salignorans]
MRVWLRRQVYRALTSSARREARRKRAEAKRVRRNEPHRVHYFHRPGDPACALMAPLAVALCERFDIELTVHLTGLPAADVNPDPERLPDCARRDTAALARQFGLPFTDPGHAPDSALEARAAAIVTAALNSRDVLQAAIATDEALWRRDDGAMAAAAAGFGEASPEAAANAAEQGSALRDELGHFQSATLYYGGEWYWTADRLHYLEARLTDLGAARAGTSTSPLAPPLLESQASGESGGVLEVYPSLRSPYTYLAMERAFALADRWQTQVEIRFVLPMVMRSLPVPRRKGQYFLLDAKREAERLGLPFGNICDPLGPPTERGLAVLHFAMGQDKGREFLTSFLRGVWAEGVDAGSDHGLRLLVERAGLDWAAAKAALGDESWRVVAETNRERLLELGLWGVPSFHTGGLSVWGQDRLWRIEQALSARAEANSS